MALSVLDAAGRRRSPATMPGYHAGRPPHNKGIRYPADPPTVDEIVAVMRHTAEDRHGARLRAMIVVLWRAGLRIQEALALGEHDLMSGAGRSLSAAARATGAARSGWTSGAGSTSARGLPCAPSCRSGRCSASSTARRVAARGRPLQSAPSFAESPSTPVSGVGLAPHQLRHAHALELAREGVPLNIIQRQLGHTNLGTTSIHLQGIDPEEIITAVRTRRAPMMSVSAGLRL